MKLNPTLVLGIAVAAGIGGFTWLTLRFDSPLMAREPELRWLQQEFSLDDAVLVRIADLHRRYTADCKPMCTALRLNGAALESLIASQEQMTPALVAALGRSNQIVAECQEKMLKHFYAVAREMPPDKGKRYLAIVTPIATHPEQDWIRMKP